MRRAMIIRLLLFAIIVTLLFMSLGGCSQKSTCHKGIPHVWGKWYMDEDLSKVLNYRNARYYERNCAVCGEPESIWR